MHKGSDLSKVQLKPIISTYLDNAQSESSLGVTFQIVYPSTIFFLQEVNFKWTGLIVSSRNDYTMSKFLFIEGLLLDDFHFFSISQIICTAHIKVPFGVELHSIYFGITLFGSFCHYKLFSITKTTSSNG